MSKNWSVHTNIICVLKASAIQNVMHVKLKKFKWSIQGVVGLKNCELESYELLNNLSFYQQYWNQIHNNSMTEQFELEFCS